MAPPHKERLDRQINIRMTTAEHEYLIEWASKNMWATGMLARLIMRSSIRAHASKTGTPLPIEVEDHTGEEELLDRALAL